MSNKKASSINLSPVPTQKASESIYQQISELIMSGQLAPGDRLPSERAMMEQLQRSRPTIREALRMLERAGLIKTIPGSNGAIVTEPSTTSFEQPLENMIAMNKISPSELLEVRELFEKTAVQWAVERRTEENLQELKEAIEASEKVGDDFAEFVKHDVAFHTAIAKAAHNELAGMISKVCHQMVLSILKNSYESKNAKQKKEMMDNIKKSHRLIYQSVLEQDVDAAYENMKAHIDFFSGDLK